MTTDDVPLVLFACVAKLGSGAYGARHARVTPSVMQCILAVRVIVVIKPSSLNIVAQGLSNSIPPLPSLTLIHTSLKKREVVQQQHLHLTHTVMQAWWCSATLHLSYSWDCASPQHWYVKGHVPSRKEWKKKDSPIIHHSNIMSLIRLYLNLYHNDRFTICLTHFILHDKIRIIGLHVCKKMACVNIRCITKCH